MSPLDAAKPPGGRSLRPNSGDWLSPERNRMVFINRRAQTPARTRDRRRASGRQRATAGARMLTAMPDVAGPPRPPINDIGCDTGVVMTAHAWRVSR